MKKLLVSGIVASILTAPAFAMEHENKKEKDWSKEGKQEMQEVERDAKAGAQNMEEGIETAGAEANISDEGNFKNQPVSLDDAKKVQEKLADKGFYEGDIDGKIGPMTSTGIEKFQENNDLTASGELNQETLDALGVDASLMQAQEEAPAAEANRNTDSSVDANSDSSATRQGDYQYDDKARTQEDIQRQQELQEQENINSRNQEHLRPKKNESSRVNDPAQSDVDATESEY